MKPEIFMHHFQSKSDICYEFGINEHSLDNCHVYLAYYHIGDYGCDSSAFVLFEKDGELYEVHGSHCSCHGLDTLDYSGGGTQWEPELVSVEALSYRLKEGELGFVGGYDGQGYREESKQVVNYLLSNLQHPNG